VHRDVAAVVDIGELHAGHGDDAAQHVLRHRAGHGRHRRDEVGAMRPGRLDHAFRGRVARHRRRAEQRRPQQRHLGRQRRQQPVQRRQAASRASTSVARGPRCR
jgi:hypothetical protein